MAGLVFKSEINEAVNLTSLHEPNSFSGSCKINVDAESTGLSHSRPTAIILMLENTKLVDLALCKLNNRVFGNAHTLS